MLLYVYMVQKGAKYYLIFAAIFEYISVYINSSQATTYFKLQINGALLITIRYFYEK